MAEYLLFLFFMNLFSLTKGRGLAPPTLTAHPSVITKTDSVTLNCQPPPSVSGPVSLCYFYTTDGQNWQNPNCSQSVRGSNLLMPNQTPPAQVKVQCYYVVEWRQAVSASYPSDQTPVTVHLRSMKPGISLQAFDTEVSISCSPPPSATGSKCHLYFGESTQPHSTVNSAKKGERLFCQFYVSKMDFVLNFHKVQRKVVSCDVTLGNGPSPRSEQKDFTVYMRKYYPDLLHVTSAPLDPEKTTDPQHETGSGPEAVPSEAVLPEAVPPEAVPPEAVLPEAVPPASQPHVTSAPLDPEKTTDPQHETDTSKKVSISIWLLVTLTSCGLVVGSALTIQIFFCSKWIKGKRHQRVNTVNRLVDRSLFFLTPHQAETPDLRTMDKVEIQTEDEYEQVEDTGTYMPLNRITDVYATIHDQPSATPMDNINLSTV